MTLRGDRQGRHPFAATTYYIAQGISRLRVLHKNVSNLNGKVFYRGMKDLMLTMEMVRRGGTEYACMSASASKDVAVGFAESDCPLIFKLNADSLMSCGADIRFLSVYPHEREVLYPPLTYLQLVREPKLEVLGGLRHLMVEVKPTLASLA